QALIDFVHRSAPSDRIGVAAYLKMAVPSTDHDGVDRFLTLFRQRHEAIENLIARDDLSASIATPARLRQDTRTAIDGLFQTAALETVDLAGSTGTAESRYNDFSYLRNVLFYLNGVEGEKNTIVVTERLFAVGARATDPRQDFWVEKATAARTALIFLDAGG